MFVCYCNETRNPTVYNEMPLCISLVFVYCETRTLPFKVEKWMDVDYIAFYLFALNFNYGAMVRGIAGPFLSVLKITARGLGSLKVTVCPKPRSQSPS